MTCIINFLQKHYKRQVFHRRVEDNFAHIILVKTERTTWTRDENNESKQELELPLFNFALIEHATDDFSSYNKLGEGGFGPVYKVRLQHTC